MKAVILAGGYGTRLSEETDRKPKPMVQIGEHPILWHIMKMCSAYGINDFVICAGYKSYVIKEYFANYFLHTSDITFDIANNKIDVHTNKSEPWSVTVINTGMDTMTGGRVKRVKEYLNGEDFLLTYGDGLSDVNIDDLISFHRNHGLLATVTAVRPPSRFGALSIGKDSVVTDFEEKPLGEGGRINGGFFVLSNKILDYIESDHTHLELEPMTRLAKEGQLSAFQHDGFWQPMDTLRDKKRLESLYESGKAPWVKW